MSPESSGTDRHVTVTPDVVARYVNAVNADDWATVASCYATDAEMVTVGTSVVRGNDAIAAHMREEMGSLPAHHDEPTRVVHAHPLVVLWMRVSARNESGRSVQFDAVDVIELTDDGSAIVRLETWWNTAALDVLRG